MPKRRHDMEFIVKKLLKLEQSFKKARYFRNSVPTISSSSSSRSSSSSSSRDSSPERTQNYQEANPIVRIDASNDGSRLPVENTVAPLAEEPPAEEPPAEEPPAEISVINLTDNLEGPIAAPDPEEDIAEILGADPTITQEYGPDINKDVATRFTHVATNGLDKNIRVEFIKKNITPGNCSNISAPQLNAEIKAAVPDAVAKRDKAIETRQKQMAAGISCLGKIISDQLSKTEKDNELIKELMEVGRIFCDIQHSDSEMRRNFALYSVRKELKDQLSTTKIDQLLFGKNFTETIKTAKAVSKSSSDLKPDPIKKPKPATSAGPSSRHLNWKARGRPRRQPMPQPPRQQPSAPQNQNAPPRVNSSQNYAHRSKQTRRQ